MPDYNRSIVNTATAPQPIGAHSQAIRTAGGELMFIAGQVALDAQGDLVGQGDVATQTRQVFENIRQILASQGATMSNIVEFTTYVVRRSSVEGYIQGRLAVFPDLFPQGDFPPNTLLVIEGLVQEDFLVEISAIAALP